MKTKTHCVPFFLFKSIQAFFFFVSIQYLYTHTHWISQINIKNLSVALFEQLFFLILFFYNDVSRFKVLNFCMISFIFTKYTNAGRVNVCVHI